VLNEENQFSLKPVFDKFVIAVGAVIALAYVFPHLGGKNSPLPLDQISGIGIGLIFFFYGLKLDRSQLRSSLKNWKLHFLIQGSTFILFPLIVLVFYPFVKSESAFVIWLSFFFLASLPSTVSSSVVMVSIAKGNVAGAIFNASMSGLIGIIITPLWMGLFLQQMENDFNPGPVYAKLFTEILAPVITGLILQKYWGRYALKYSRHLSFFDKSVILLIIYKSFSESFESDIFAPVSILDLLWIFLAVILLFLVVYGLTGFLSKRISFSKEDQITAQFCGTKKSLVHGTVYSKILFPATIPSGLILVPLMIFHTLQILFISIMAGKLEKRKE
jgi:sodium/bile acid cotransporter 7